MKQILLINVSKYKNLTKLLLVMQPKKEAQLIEFIAKQKEEFMRRQANTA